MFLLLLQIWLLSIWYRRIYDDGDDNDDNEMTMDDDHNRVRAQFTNQCMGSKTYTRTHIYTKIHRDGQRMTLHTYIHTVGGGVDDAAAAAVGAQDKMIKPWMKSSSNPNVIGINRSRKFGRIQCQCVSSEECLIDAGKKVSNFSRGEVDQIDVDDDGW